MNPRLHSALSTALEQLAAQDRRRVLHPLAVQDGALYDAHGQRQIDASSNDYLGLSQHPLARQRAAEWAQRHGAGAPASRLVTGTRDITVAVEEKLARFKGSDAALLFPSGFQCNATVIPALAALGPTAIFSDALSHSSLVHGCRLAKAKTQVFRHNDLAHLADLLENTVVAERREGTPTAKWIVTETVFSMDGDRAPLPELAALARRHDASLYVDEAHATGALGPQGRGLACEVDGVDVVMGTLGKGLGAFGAYVAGPRVLIDYLINRAAGFIYTTALPPAVLGAVDAALDLAPDMDAERRRLAANADALRAALHAKGLDTLQSSTQIVPAIIGGEAAALAASQRMREAGILAVAIRPPTVPAGTSRLRFSLGAAMSDGDLQRLLAAVAAL